MKQTIFIAVGLLVLLLASCAVTPPEEKTGVKKFTSQAELIQFLKDNQGSSYGYGYYGRGVMMKGAVLEEAIAVPTAAAADVAGGADEYSTTNIQVEGVDEADIVKNDGKYIYIVSGKKVVIVDAYPAENAKILSEIEFKGTPSEIFINKDRLVVIGQDYNPEPRVAEKTIAAERMMPSYRSSTEAFINLYDVSDRSDPELEKEFSVDANYFDSRMIGNYVYIIANQDVYYNDNIVPLPRITYDGVTKEIPASDIYYFPMPDDSHQYTHIISLNTQEEEEPLTKVFLIGANQNLFVSQNNIYTTGMKRVSPIYYWEKMVDKVISQAYPAVVSIEINRAIKSDKSMYEKQNEIQKITENYYNSLSSEDEKRAIENKMQQSMIDFEQDIAKETQKTVIHKISVKDGDINYETQGEVSGNVLNQFSMDEYNGNFRIATTISGYSNNKDISTNNVYVLDEDLNTIGEVEDIAFGESIYAVRFMGDRAYMVTFKHVDPLFVIDLSDPSNPKVLGKLKIPGYSDYLHPYDATHLIGIGKEVDESIDADKVHTEGAVYYTAIQGVKLALFDVSDVSNPIEMYKEVIGDRGTESLATSEHKAFLFDKNNELLVVPMTVAERKPGQPKEMEGEFVFQGAYVYTLNLEDGFNLRGRVSHIEDKDAYDKSGYYFYSPYSIKRSLYMDEVLYTLSDKAIKMNDLNGMEELNKLGLPYEEGMPSYVVY